MQKVQGKPWEVVGGKCSRQKGRSKCKVPGARVCWQGQATATNGVAEQMRDRNVGRGSTVWGLVSHEKTELGSRGKVLSREVMVSNLDFIGITLAVSAKQNRSRNTPGTTPGCSSLAHY